MSEAPKPPDGLPTEFYIREADAADIPPMVRLAQGEPKGAQWPLAQYHNIFAAGSAPRIALLIVQGNTASLAGFLVGRCLGEEWEVENIVIAAAYRKNGLGTRLLREFAQRAKSAGAHSVGLEVRESNRAAQALYRKSGFTEISHRKNYYSAPEEDALIFQLALR